MVVAGAGVLTAALASVLPAGGFAPGTRGASVFTGGACTPLTADLASRSERSHKLSEVTMKRIAVKLRFVADRPPPSHVFEQVALTRPPREGLRSAALMAAEESGEYF